MLFLVGSGGGCLREGSGGGPLGVLPGSGWVFVAMLLSLGMLKDFCLTTGLRSGIWGLGRVGVKGEAAGSRPTWAALSEAMRCWRVMGWGSSAILGAQNTAFVQHDVGEAARRGRV